MTKSLQMNRWRGSDPWETLFFLLLRDLSGRQWSAEDSELLCEPCMEILDNDELEHGTDDRLALDTLFLHTTAY